MSDCDGKNQENHPGKWCFLVPWLLFAASLAVRTTSFCLRDRLHRDAYRYIDFARDLVASGWDWHSPLITEKMSFPPLMAILDGLFIEIGLAPKVAGGIVSVFFGALLPVAVYLLARQLFQEKKYAVVAALLTIFHPGCVDVGSTVLRDPLYLFFFASALALGVNIAKTKKSVWWYILYGVLSGLALLCRKEGVELPAIALLWLTCELLFTRDIPFWKRLGKALSGALLLLLAAALTMLPVAWWTSMNIGVYLGK